MQEYIKHYNLGKTVQEFEEIFGNIPINDIDKIKKHLLESYIPTSLIKEKIEEYKKLLKSCNKFSDVDRIKAINERILAYEELLNGKM